MKKKFLSMLIVSALAVIAMGCSNNANETSKSTALNNSDESVSADVKAKITLNNNSISTDGDGVEVVDKTITINSGGTYEISGTLEDGQIIVDSADEINVYIILNRVDISCSNSAPIYVKSAKNAIITLADNSENYLSDGSEYLYEELNDDRTVTDEPSACIFSKDDLTINGNGTLNVVGNYNNGIVSKDDLKITAGTVNVTAVNNGLKGKDSITIKGGDITVNSTGDGVKSDNTEDTTKGYIIIEGGSLNITSGKDGIQAETTLTIVSGDINIVSGGGSSNAAPHAESFKIGPWGNSSSTSGSSSSETASAKGLKADTNLTVDGGNITIDSADDSVHTNDTVTINGGKFNIKSGDDGIHADSALIINGGDINITESYEGLEAADITINNGNINLVSSDDGLNAAGGNDTSQSAGMFGGDQFSASSGIITINGGYIVVDAAGDGIDANGSVKMTNGIVIVNGPENGGNGALDYDKTFDISGGILVAAGSNGMVQAPSTSSSQPSINVSLPTSSNNSMVSILDASGNTILSFTPSKTYQSVIISTPELVKGSNYSVYYGGSNSGSESNGLYTDGIATGGTELTSFTLSSSVMTVSRTGATEGVSGGMGAPGGMGGMQGGGRPQR